MQKGRSVDQRERRPEGKTPAAQAPEQERDDAAQAGQPYYRSQQEVDAAFARRLAAARRKWSRDAGAQGQAPGAAAQAVPAQATMAQPAEGLGAYVPAQPGMAGMAQAPAPQPAILPGLSQGSAAMGANGAQGLPPAAGQEEPAAAGMEGLPGDETSRIAMWLLAEEADIQQIFPGFDLESFIASDERIRDALLEGRSLWSVFASVYGGIVRKQAESDAVERVRSRNSAVPDVLRSGGAAGAVAPDYANMPSDQFNRLRKEYEAQMRLGKKVKP